MKRLMMLKKRIKGEEFRAVDMSLAKGGAITKDKNMGMSVRETTRIHALTGVPWEQVNKEATKNERV